EEKTPAYIIFSDATLKDMEEKMPLSEGEFARIKGVGEVKQKKYASRFVEEISKFRPPKTPTYKRSLQLYLEGISPEEIAVKRNLKAETIYSHLLKAHKQGEPVEIEKFLSQEELDEIRQAQEELKDTPILKNYYSFFEERIPYWKIKYGLHLLAKETLVQKEESVEH